MNPVTISVIPGVKAQRRGFPIPPEFVPEDVSVVIAKITQGDRPFVLPYVMPNTKMPLSKLELDAVRKATRINLEKHLAEEKKAKAKKAKKSKVNA